MFKTLRVSNINSNYYDNIDERYTTSNDLTEGAPQWRIWDGADWAAPDPPITGCLAPDRWHRFALSGRIVKGSVRYDKLVVDGRQHGLAASFSQVRDSSNARLAVAVQADGNATSTPYRFWIDRVRLALGR